MEHLTIKSQSVEDTERIGELLGRTMSAGDILGLEGELGAGKTALTRGLARGAGVLLNVPVNSPTFTIMNVYDCRQFRLFHLDLYRIGSHDELPNIGLSDMVGPGRALVVEWIDRFPQVFPADILRIRIEGEGEGMRCLNLVAGGEESAEWLEEFLSENAGATP